MCLNSRVGAADAVVHRLLVSIQVADLFEGDVTGCTAMNPLGAVRQSVVLQVTGGFKGFRTEGAPKWSDFRVHQLVLSEVVRKGVASVALFALVDSGFSFTAVV